MWKVCARELLETNNAVTSALYFSGTDENHT